MVVSGPEVFEYGQAASMSGVGDDADVHDDEGQCDVPRCLHCCLRLREDIRG